MSTKPAIKNQQSDFAFGLQTFLESEDLWDEPKTKKSTRSFDQSKMEKKLKEIKQKSDHPNDLGRKCTIL